MTASGVNAGSGDASGAAYEELRSQAIAGGGIGLAVLLREGVAGWMSQRQAGSAPMEPATAPLWHAAPPVVSDEIHAGVVRVLASMALAARKEMPA